MALSKLILSIALFTLLLDATKAQSGCTTTLMGLTPCLSYINGNTSTPSSSCCSQLSNVVQTRPDCLCLLLNGGASSYGVNVNQTLALALPGACKVQTPPVSKCNTGNGPTASPSTPVSPAPSSSKTPAAPTTNTPSGIQSKIAPSANGSNTMEQSGFVGFMLLIASWALYVSAF